MMLNAISGVPQAMYSPPYCRLSRRSKEIATIFGQHLPRSCARRQEQMRHGLGMTPFCLRFPLARSCGGGFGTLSGEAPLNIRNWE